MRRRKNSFGSRYGVKEKWVSITPTDMRRDRELRENLFSMLQLSYAPIGGHTAFKKPMDLVDEKLTFFGIDIDDDPDADAFGVAKRKKAGFKSVAGGSDGTKRGKAAYINRTGDNLSTCGFFAEMSGGIAHMMLKYKKAHAITDPAIVRDVLGGKKITWLGRHPDGKYPYANGWYLRNIGGHDHMKIMLGYPKIEGVQCAPQRKNKMTRRRRNKTIKNPHGEVLFNLHHIDEIRPLKSGGASLFKWSHEKMVKVGELTKDQFSDSRFKAFRGFQHGNWHTNPRRRANSWESRLPKAGQIYGRKGDYILVDHVYKPDSSYRSGYISYTGVGQQGVTSKTLLEKDDWSGIAQWERILHSRPNAVGMMSGGMSGAEWSGAGYRKASKLPLGWKKLYAGWRKKMKGNPRRRRNAKRVYKGFEIIKAGTHKFSRSAQKQGAPKTSNVYEIRDAHTGFKPKIGKAYSIEQAKEKITGYLFGQKLHGTPYRRNAQSQHQALGAHMAYSPSGLQTMQALVPRRRRNSAHVHKGVIFTGQKKTRDLQRHSTFYFAVDGKVVSMKEWLDLKVPVEASGYAQDMMKKILLHKARQKMSFGRLMDFNQKRTFQTQMKWLYDNGIKVTKRGVSSRNYDRR